MAAPTSTKEKTAYETLVGLTGAGDSLGTLLPKIEKFVFYLGLGVCVIYLILAGYHYFFGEADSSKKNIEDATKSLTYAIVGFVILILLRVIFIIIARILGFTFNPSNI